MSEWASKHESLPQTFFSAGCSRVSSKKALPVAVDLLFCQQRFPRELRNVGKAVRQGAGGSWEGEPGAQLLWKLRGGLTPRILPQPSTQSQNSSFWRFSFSIQHLQASALVCTINRCTPSLLVGGCPLTPRLGGAEKLRDIRTWKSLGCVWLFAIPWTA